MRYEESAIKMHRQWQYTIDSMMTDHHLWSVQRIAVVDCVLHFLKNSCTHKKCSAVCNTYYLRAAFLNMHHTLILPMTLEFVCPRHPQSHKFVARSTDIWVKSTPPIAPAKYLYCDCMTTYGYDSLSRQCPFISQLWREAGLAAERDK